MAQKPSIIFLQRQEQTFYFSSDARAICQQLLVLVSKKQAIERFYPFLCTANVEECLKISFFIVLFFFTLDQLESSWK